MFIWRIFLVARIFYPLSFSFPLNHRCANRGQVGCFCQENSSNARLRGRNPVSGTVYDSLIEGGHGILGAEILRSTLRKSLLHKAFPNILFSSRTMRWEKGILGRILRNLTTCGHTAILWWSLYNQKPHLPRQRRRYTQPTFRLSPKFIQCSKRISHSSQTRYVLDNGNHRIKAKLFYSFFSWSLERNSYRNWLIRLKTNSTRIN